MFWLQSTLLACKRTSSCCMLRGDAAAALAQDETVAAEHPRLRIGAAGRVQSLSALGRREEAQVALSPLLHEWSGGCLPP